MNHQENIESAYENYLAVVEKEAAIFFTDVFKPFLKKRNLTFMAGNGTFFIHTKKRDLHVHLEDIKKFKWLYDILADTVPGTNNGFGEFMPDYNLS
jgi:uncharacterized membrane protein YobD (UPF0266 family)